MIREQAHAKINLALDVVKKRIDGYHELKMILIPIELHDILEFEPHNELVLKSNVQIEDNAILKAAKLMQLEFNITSGAKITLKKMIPIGAGLGGGSADIAATLRGLNQLWGLNKNLEDLEELALKLGSDTLFCLYNQPAYVYGRGESLLFIDNPPIKDIYLFLTEVSVSTKEIFENHKIKYHSRQFDRLFRNYLNEKYILFFKKTYNQLTKTTLMCYPSLKKVYSQVKRLNFNCLMSGSGSTFYLLTFKQNGMDLEDKITKSGLHYLKTEPKI